jgi:uncharacterized protein (TIGR03435 family)
MTESQKLFLETHVPKWVTTDRFDIEARSENADATKDQMRMMMRSLLKDRFGFVAHSETQQLPVFALVVAKPGKLGPTLRPHKEDDPVCGSTDPVEPTGGTSKMPVSDDGFPAICGSITYVMAKDPSGGRFFAKGARNVTMDVITSSLLGMGYTGLDRPVLNKTGLNGTYDFRLDVEISRIPTPDYRPDASEWFVEELRDQLGLKLEKQTGPVDVLVVDKVEQPSEN